MDLPTVVGQQTLYYTEVSFSFTYFLSLYLNLTGSSLEPAMQGAASTCCVAARHYIRSAAPEVQQLPAAPAAPNTTSGLQRRKCNSCLQRPTLHPVCCAGNTTAACSACSARHYIRSAAPAVQQLPAAPGTLLAAIRHLQLILYKLRTYVKRQQTASRRCRC